MDLLVGKLSAHNQIMPQVNLSTVSWQATFGIVIVLLQTLASSGDLNLKKEKEKYVRFQGGVQLCTGYHHPPDMPLCQTRHWLCILGNSTKLQTYKSPPTPLSCENPGNW